MGNSYEIIVKIHLDCIKSFSFEEVISWYGIFDKIKNRIPLYSEEVDGHMITYSEEDNYEDMAKFIMGCLSLAYIESSCDLSPKEQWSGERYNNAMKSTIRSINAYFPEVVKEYEFIPQVKEVLDGKSI